jgi:hypothetical protein
VRTYWRQRGEHVRGASTCVQRMQKVLTQMNVQLANVISDLSGLTGQAIVRAILAGERDPRNLAELSHPLPRPRVITVDGNPSYPKAIAELKQERELGHRCRCRTCPYLNNVVEQDHRAIKRRVNASQGFRSFDGAWRTIQGYEVLHMMRKGQVRWLPKGDVVGQIQFIRETLGLKS